MWRGSIPGGTSYPDRRSSMILFTTMTKDLDHSPRDLLGSLCISMCRPLICSRSRNTSVTSSHGRAYKLQDISLERPPSSSATNVDGAPLPQTKNQNGGFNPPQGATVSSKAMRQKQCRLFFCAGTLIDALSVKMRCAQRYNKGTLLDLRAANLSQAKCMNTALLTRATIP